MTIVLCIKELTEYLYQQEAVFRPRSRDLLETEKRQCRIYQP